LIIGIFALGIASLAQAQATRTWVSGVGDDANPCSRTAPCKTYAGAISKTAAGGIISTLDPGGFGAVTITKSITIEGTGTLGSILNAGTNGVVISAANTDVINLRDLSIHGAGSGINGVRILNAGEVYIQNCNIQNQSQDGIDIGPSAAGLVQKVFVQNSKVFNNAQTGIQVFPSGTASAKLVIENSSVSGNSFNGLDVAGNNNSASVYNSTLNHNTLNGAIVQLTSSTIFIESSQISYNGTGVLAGLAGQSPVVHLSHNIITGNTTNGVTTQGTGTQIGYFNNTIVGNGGDNTVSSSTAQQ
jgi:hypothetical protein